MWSLKPTISLEYHSNIDGLTSIVVVYWILLLMVLPSVHSVVMKQPRGVQGVALSGIAQGNKEERECSTPSTSSSFRECQVKNWKKHKPSCDMLYQSKPHPPDHSKPHPS